MASKTPKQERVADFKCPHCGATLQHVPGTEFHYCPPCKLKELVAWARGNEIKQLQRLRN